MNDMPGNERADLARLLPAPAVADLTGDRHRDLKDAYMQTLTEVRPPKPARRRWALIAAPATAVAVAAVAIVAVTLSRSGDDAATRTTAAPIIAVEPGSVVGLGPLIDRLALSAAGKPDTRVGAGQFVYVHSKVAWLVYDKQGATPRFDKVHDREVWLPASHGDKGLIRERGETFGLTGARPNSEYADLPTDPTALLRKIYAETEGQNEGPDDAAFEYIGTALRESILAPKVNAALYRAAARIPGVVLVQDSVDAAGRHGIAVARTDNLGERQEWIFDPATFDYLGERSYLVRDTSDGKAGRLTGTTAVLQRGVVNKTGELP
jgi:hypothetical protein